MTTSSTSFRWNLLLLAIVVWLSNCSTANAFYFRGWPGSALPKEQTLMSSKAPNIGGPSHGEDFSTTTYNPPGTNRPTGNPSVPEPATGLLAIVGVGLIAAVRKWRNKVLTSAV